MTRDDMPYRPCVGVVLADAEGRIFVGERLDKSGAWQMPQGGIDDGETPRDAALRELWEETGVAADMVTVEAETADWVTYDLPEDLIGKLWGGKYRGQKQKWVLLRFHGTDGDIRIETDHPEFGQWKWSDKSRVLDEIVPFKRHVYVEVMKAFGERI